MNFREEKSTFKIEIEDAYITSYMPSAPSNFVKVYLYILYLAKKEESMDLGKIADSLNLSLKEVKDAIGYWNEVGLISERDEDVVIISSKGDGLKTTKPSSKFNEEGRRELFEQIGLRTGKILTAKDMSDINSWFVDLGANDYLVLKAYEYCANNGKLHSAYIEKVVIDWIEKGLDTEEKIDEFLLNHGERAITYKNILKEIGQYRNPTKAEQDLMDKWLDEQHLKLEDIILAAKSTISISSPSLKYIDKVLQEKEIKKNQGREVSNSDLNSYYEYLRESAVNKANRNKEKAYEKIPDLLEIDNKIKDTNSKVLKAAINLNFKERDSLNIELSNLNEERKELLLKNGVSPESLEVMYSCNKCNDTGIDDYGKRCTCALEKAKLAKEWLKTK